jgi:hypothetical protein
MNPSPSKPPRKIKHVNPHSFPRPKKEKNSIVYNLVLTPPTLQNPKEK